MILEYSVFLRELNDIMFKGNSEALLTQIANMSDIHIDIFKLTALKTNLIQNILQLYEIKFYMALEGIVQKYFNILGFTVLPNHLVTKETIYCASCDMQQIVKKRNTIYLIEQKIRDDHDSTKKVGQFTNFEAKYFEISNKYKDSEVIPIMWFIDASLRKNKNYYLEQMEKMSSFYDCSPRLYYGQEMFSKSENGISDFPIDMWNEIVEYLKLWKKNLPDMPEVNFDLNSEQVFLEIRDLSPCVYRKLFENEDIKQQILPIIFGKGIVLEKLKDYFLAKNQLVYNNLASIIGQYLAELRDNKAL